VVLTDMHLHICRERSRGGRIVLDRTAITWDRAAVRASLEDLPTAAVPTILLRLCGPDGDLVMKAMWHPGSAADDLIRLLIPASSA